MRGIAFANIYDMPVVKALIGDCESKIMEATNVRVNLVPVFEPEERQLPELSRLRTLVCNTYGITWDRLTTMSRKQHIVAARQIFCYVAVEVLKFGKSEIGRMLEQDHTTIIHSCNTVRNWIETGYKEKSNLEFIMHQLMMTNPELHNKQS